MVLIAGQREILRAAQRDDIFQKKLSEKLSQLISGIFGIRHWIKWKNSIENLSNLIYYSLTTLGNTQTLGEEYIGIIQWSSNQKLPSKQIQCLMVFLNCFGERVLINLLERFEKTLQDLPEEHPLRQEARTALIQTSETIKKMLPFLIRLHQAVFYYQGKYYHVSKRVTGIHYALIRFWLSDMSLLPTFRFLGFISCLNLLATALTAQRQSFTTTASERQSNQLAQSAFQCSLCLNPRINTSSTPCGHLFCWNCIVPWLLEQPLCPLCRQAVQPSRVVLLRNLEKQQ